MNILNGNGIRFTEAKMIKVYFDGCCEPVNPGGTAAYGVAIYNDFQRIWEESRVFVPKAGRERETSNNVAEYSGFIAALDWLLKEKLENESIQVYGDSMLVLCQMLMDDPTYGIRWKIKKGLYKPLAHKALRLLKKFPNIRGQWIPREENSIADELSKAELIKRGVQFKIQPEEGKL